MIGIKANVNSNNLGSNYCYYVSHVHLLLLLLVMQEILLLMCEGKARGAPTTACRSLDPSHGFMSQTTSAPYEIRASPSVIYSNETVTVTIRVISKKYRFKGFIMQAKSTEYWQKVYFPAIGTFRFTEGTRRLNCYHGDHNTITHSHSQHTEEMSTVWMPPYKFRGRVTFMATIVATFKVFWNKIYSNTIEVVDYPGERTKASSNYI